MTGTTGARMAWTCHPLRDEPWLKSLALAGAIVASAAVMGVSLEGAVYGVVAFVVLVLATVGYLLPTHYALDAEGVASRQFVWRRRPWSSFRRAVRQPDGIFLGPLRRPSRLDAFRGMFLRFGPDADVTQIDALVQAHVAD